MTAKLKVWRFFFSVQYSKRSTIRSHALLRVALYPCIKCNLTGCLSGVLLHACGWCVQRWVIEAVTSLRSWTRRKRRYDNCCKFYQSPASLCKLSSIYHVVSCLVSSIDRLKLSRLNDMFFEDTLCRIACIALAMLGWIMEHKLCASVEPVIITFDGDSLYRL